MIKRRLIFGIFLILMIFWISVPQVFTVDLELTERKQLTLDVSPLDIAASADARWLFILAPGEILVYSILEDKVVNRIPVKNAFDTLTYSGTTNTLVLSSRSEKTIKIIRLEVVHAVEISGLPFKGLENAEKAMQLLDVQIFT